MSDEGVVHKRSVEIDAGDVAEMLCCLAGVSPERAHIIFHCMYPLHARIAFRDDERDPEPHLAETIKAIIHVDKSDGHHSIEMPHEKIEESIKMLEPPHGDECLKDWFPKGEGDNIECFRVYYKKDLSSDSKGDMITTEDQIEVYKQNAGDIVGSFVGVIGSMVAVILSFVYGPGYFLTAAICFLIFTSSLDNILNKKAA